MTDYSEAISTGSAAPAHHDPDHALLGDPHTEGNPHLYDPWRDEDRDSLDADLANSDIQN